MNGKSSPQTFQSKGLLFTPPVFSGVIRIKKNTVNINYVIEKLRNETIRAKLNWDIYWIYKNKRDRQKYVDVLNNYPLFFQTSLAAHYTQTVISLGKIYDSENINLKYLLKLALDEGLVSRATEVAIKEKLKEINKIIRKLLIIRNNTVAHISAKLTHEQVFNKANANYREFQKLIHYAFWILEKIYKEVKGEELHSRNLFSAVEDTRRVLNILKKEI